eukprot:GAHX01002308.1.p1 GENE.GAHX01002308.1~~GAHX01002308.1.p1  ORF type:complete len:900 (+),score=134.70 GAHX01002308.1:154-2853(+)
MLLKGTNSTSLVEVKCKIQNTNDDDILTSKSIADFLSFLFQLMISLRSTKRLIKKKLFKISIKLGLNFTIRLLDIYFSLLNKDIPATDITRVFRFYVKLLKSITETVQIENPDCILNTLVSVYKINSKFLKEMAIMVFRNYHVMLNKQVCLEKLHSTNIEFTINFNNLRILLGLVAEIHGIRTVTPYLSLLIEKGSVHLEFALGTIKYLTKNHEETLLENIKEVITLLNSIDLSIGLPNDILSIYLSVVKSLAKRLVQRSNCQLQTFAPIILGYTKNRNFVLRQTAFNALYWLTLMDDENNHRCSIESLTLVAIDEIKKITNTSHTEESITNAFFRGSTFYLKMLNKCLLHIPTNKNDESNLKVEIFNLMFLRLMNKKLIFKKTHYVVRNKLYATLQKTYDIIIERFSPRLISNTLLDYFSDLKESSLGLMFFCLQQLLKKTELSNFKIDEKKVISFIFDTLQEINDNKIKIIVEDETFFEGHLFSYETKYYDKHYMYRNLVREMLIVCKQLLAYIMNTTNVNVANISNLLFQRLQWFAASKNMFVRFLASLLISEIISFVSKLDNLVSRDICIDRVFSTAYNDLIGASGTEVEMFGVFAVLMKITKTRLLFVSNESYKRVLNLLPPLINAHSTVLVYLALKLIKSISKRLAHEIDDEKCWNKIMVSIVEFAFKVKQKNVKVMASSTIGCIAKDIGPLDCIYYLVQGLSNPRRSIRIWCSISILEITKKCGAFSVIPVLLNEYGAKNKLLRLGVLKSIQLIMSEETPENTNYINSLVNIIEDAVKDKDIVHRQIGCFIISNIAKLVVNDIECYFDLFLHFLNLIWPSILEDEFGMAEAFENTVMDIGTIIGVDVIVMYTGSGLFHPVKAVRERCWGILNLCWEADSSITSQILEVYFEL